MTSHNGITVVTDREGQYQWFRGRITDSIIFPRLYFLRLIFLHVLQQLLISYRVFLCLAPSFDQTLVPSIASASCDVSDHRFVQLRGQGSVSFAWILNSTSKPSHLDSFCHLDDGAGEGVRDDLQQLGRVLSRLDVEGLDQEVGESEEDARRCFQRQKDYHRQPIEEVVDGGASERP